MLFLSPLFLPFAPLLATQSNSTAVFVWDQSRRLRFEFVRSGETRSAGAVPRVDCAALGCVGAGDKPSEASQPRMMRTMLREGVCSTGICTSLNCWL